MCNFIGTIGDASEFIDVKILLDIAFIPPLECDNQFCCILSKDMWESVLKCALNSESLKVLGDIYLYVKEDCG